MGATILIVEDEPSIARVLELELDHEGYRTLVAMDGNRGLQLAMGETVDLILLDIMLPGQSGIELLRRLRKEKSTPVILLTARDDVSDKVTGLDLGADDYITKPYKLEELLARVRAALRRSTHANQGETLLLGGLMMDISRHVVSRDGRAIDLTKREFDLLEMLMRNIDIVMSRNQLLETVWGYDFEGDSNVVDVYIRYLRQKIDSGFGSKLIHTVRGVGYCMRSEV